MLHTHTQYIVLHITCTAGIGLRTSSNLSSTLNTFTASWWREPYSRLLVSDSSGLPYGKASKGALMGVLVCVSIGCDLYTVYQLGLRDFCMNKNSIKLINTKLILTIMWRTNLSVTVWIGGQLSITYWRSRHNIQMLTSVKSPLLEWHSSTECQCPLFVQSAQ